jgi:hypothetical protein
MKSYREIFEAPKRFTSDKWDHYLDVYDRHFARFRNGGPINYLEIGVQNGGSLCVAKEYFGPAASVYGIDIDPKSRAAEAAGIAKRVFIGSQADSIFLNASLAEIGAAPDIIIDDGSHTQGDMVTTFLHLFPRLAPHGCYVVEDTHTVHFPTHQNSDTGLDVYDYFKSLPDKLSLDFMAPEHRRDRFRTSPESRTGDIRTRNAMAHSIGSLHFYNSMIVVEKAPYIEPWRRVI